MQGVNMATGPAAVGKASCSTQKDSAADKGDFTSALAAVVDHKGKKPVKKVEQQNDRQTDDSKETTLDQDNQDSLVTMYVPVVVNATSVETKDCNKTTEDMLQNLQDILPNLTGQEQKNMQDLLTGLKNILSQGPGNTKNIQELFSQVQGANGEELPDFLAQLKNSLLDTLTVDANQMNQLITKMQEIVEGRKDSVGSSAVLASNTSVEKTKSELTKNSTEDKTDNVDKKVLPSLNITPAKTKNLEKGISQPASDQVLDEKKNGNSVEVKGSLTMGEKLIKPSLSGTGSEKEPVLPTVSAGSNASGENSSVVGANGNNPPTILGNGVTAEPITVAELGSKLQGMLQELKVNNQPNQTTMQFKLQPANLGDVVVKLVLNQGELTAHFYATNHQAKEALEAALPQMRDSLQQQIKVGDTTVFLQQDSQWSGGQGQNQRQSSPQLPYGKEYGKNNFGPSPEEVAGGIIQEAESVSPDLGVNRLI